MWSKELLIYNTSAISEPNIIRRFLFKDKLSDVIAFIIFAGSRRAWEHRVPTGHGDGFLMINSGRDSIVCHFYLSCFHLLWKLAPNILPQWCSPLLPHCSRLHCCRQFINAFNLAWIKCWLFCWVIIQGEQKIFPNDVILIITWPLSVQNCLAQT